MTATARISVLAALTLAGCLDPAGGATISLSPLAGRFNGRDWSASTALGTVQSGDATRLAVTVFEHAATCADLASTSGAPEGDRRLTASVPRATGGRYALGSSATVTFVTVTGGAPQNAVSNQGEIDTLAGETTDDAGATRLTVGLRAYNGNDYLDGRVRVALCP